MVREEAERANRIKFSPLTRKGPEIPSMVRKEKQWRRMMFYNWHSMTTYKDWKVKTRKRSNKNRNS